MDLSQYDTRITFLRYDKYNRPVNKELEEIVNPDYKMVVSEKLIAYYFRHHGYFTIGKTRTILEYLGIPYDMDSNTPYNGCCHFEYRPDIPSTVKREVDAKLLWDIVDTCPNDTTNNALRLLLDKHSPRIKDLSEY